MVEADVSLDGRSTYTVFAVDFLEDISPSGQRRRCAAAWRRRRFRPRSRRQPRSRTGLTATGPASSPARAAPGPERVGDGPGQSRSAVVGRDARNYIVECLEM